MTKAKTKAPAPTAEKKVAAPPPAPPAPTYVIQCLRAPFVAEGAKVIVGGKTMLYHVGALTLFNISTRSSLNTTQSEILDDILFELRTSGREIVRVERFSEYLNPDVRFEELLNSKPEKIVDLVTKLGLQFTEAEVACFSAFASARKKFMDVFKGIGDVYELKGRKGTEHAFAVSGDQVSNGRYDVTMRQAQNIVRRAIATWSKEALPEKTSTIRKDYTSHRISVTDTAVAIGCQTVTRWQIEELAVRMGWVVT